MIQITDINTSNCLYRQLELITTIANKC